MITMMSFVFVVCCLLVVSIGVLFVVCYCFARFIHLPGGMSDNLR